MTSNYIGIIINNTNILHWLLLLIILITRKHFIVVQLIYIKTCIVFVTQVVSEPILFFYSELNCFYLFYTDRKSHYNI